MRLPTSKSQTDFKVRNPEIEKIMNDIGMTLKSALPEGWGFSLMIFNTNGHPSDNSMFYISNAERTSMMAAMQEFIDRNKQ